MDAAYYALSDGAGLTVRMELDFPVIVPFAAVSEHIVHVLDGQAGHVGWFACADHASLAAR